MPPDKQQFIPTLRRRQWTFVPLAELGVHPMIKERFIGRSPLTPGEEIEFR